MSTLYDLTDDARGLMEALLAVGAMADGTDDEGIRAEFQAAQETLDAQLAAIHEQLGTKSDSYCWVIKALSAEADAYRAREEEFAAKRKARENAAKRLKDALRDVMEALGMDKIQGTDYTLALQNSPPGVSQVDEQAALAAGMAQEVTTVRVDSRAIIAAWKASPESLDGIAEVHQGRHIRIR